MVVEKHEFETLLVKFVWRKLNGIGRLMMINSVSVSVLRQSKLTKVDSRFKFVQIVAYGVMQFLC